MNKFISKLQPGGSATSIVFASLVYAALGALSLSTAYEQANAAAVWMPSGFAVGLLIVRGLHSWPAVTIGSFVLNFAVNLVSEPNAATGTLLLVAMFIAIGNTGEAVLGAFLTRRFASGAGFFSNTASAVIFTVLAVPIAPLISTIIGVAASRFGGIETTGTLLGVTLTWYVANSVGIMVFTGPTVIAVQAKFTRPALPRLIEALLLVSLLVFVSQAMCGIFLIDALKGWPKNYMLIPLVLWAAFRFGTAGAYFSIIIITVISVAGTMRGYQAFPAESAWLSLIYLQIFLAMLSLVATLISAALSQINDLQSGLAEKVRQRTGELERLLREREVFTTLVAHDLQSPLYGVRNALRAGAAAISDNRMPSHDIVAAMNVMEQTCSTLAERVASLLAPRQDETGVAAAKRPATLACIIDNIEAAHRLTMQQKAVSIIREGDMTINLHNSSEIIHILDILVDNAIKHSPANAHITVAAFQHGSTIEVLVSDRGKGVSPDQVGSLFLPRAKNSISADQPAAGIGLFLAGEKVNELGGRLAYSAVYPQGSQFRLILPRQ